MRVYFKPEKLPITERGAVWLKFLAMLVLLVLVYH